MLCILAGIVPLGKTEGCGGTKTGIGSDSYSAEKVVVAGAEAEAEAGTEAGASPDPRIG